MACNLLETQLAACESGIGKLDSPIELLKIIAQLSCEIADAGTTPPTTPGLPLNSVQFNDAGAFGGDAGLTFNKTNNYLSVTGGLIIGNASIDNASAGDGIRFTTGFTARWDILSTGHLIAITDNTLDIGASGATRPRNLFLGGGITTGSTTLHTTSVALTNGAGAGGGTLLNAPTAGNPTKWVPINDNGTTRFIPTWT